MRSVLIGAVQSTATALQAMADADQPPDLLITLPPERQGRHSDFVDLNAQAAGLGVPVFHAANVNAEETLARITAVAPDYIFVIGWSQLCGDAFLALPAKGTIGYHPAPLPRMRGRAVIPWTILLQVEETGGSLFWIDDGVDSGDLLAQETFDVAPDETAGSLYAKHLDALVRMIRAAVEALRAGDPPRLAQNHGQATYCAKRTAEDGLIDWRQPAADVLRLVRAVGRPYPGAYSHYRGERLAVWQARPCTNSQAYIGLPGQIQVIDGDHIAVCCGDGQSIDITEWQLSGDARPVLHAKLGDAR